MEAVGGPQTYVLGGAFNCGKAQPGRSRRSATAARRRCSAASTSSTPRRRPADELARSARARRRSSSGRWRCPTADGCVVIADESSDGQPALGGQHPDHQRRHARPVASTVIAIVDGGAGTARRRRSTRTGDADDVEALVRAAEAGRPRGRRRPRTPCRWSAEAPPAVGRLRTTSPPRRSIGGVRRLRPGPRRGVRRGPRRAASSCSASPSTSGDDLPRHVDRPAAAARPADRPVELNGKSPDSAAVGVGRRRHPRLHATSTSPRSTPSCARRLGWARAPGRRCRPGATRRCCRRPRSPTCMIYLYWSAAARDADEGRTVFAKPGGGTRVGERLGRAAADAAQRPARAAAWSRAPFVVARLVGVDRRSSTTACRCAPTDWISRRASWPR